MSELNAAQSAPPAMSEMEHGGHHPSQSSWALLLGSIGVVYGDIGTSPLYAFRETLVQAKSDGILTAQEVYGVLSLILWALLFIVTIKYVLILLRADNNGEGGTLSLMALARKATGHSTFIIFALGVVGASLFYGDAIITPAISVMSAVEGLKLVTPTFEPYVLPITVLVLVGLFAVQSRGTAKVAKFFGPVMVVWFFAIGAAGLIHIFDDPDVLLSFNPYYAFDYLAHHGEGALLALGAVFLAVTGAEALYADLGHFGRKPIQRAWIWLVLPCLALNYLGQGALVLAHPETVENPFFLMMPSWALLPMVLLAGMATIIASQAVITGAYSLSRQAIQLGLLPRSEIRHTSESHSGQIYMPRVTTLLLLGVLLLVVLFETSSDLASAYGIAVTGTMLVTAILTFIVMWKAWKWHPVLAALAMLPFALIDIMFLSANLLKVFDGGWVPLALAGGLMTVMGTWKRGTDILMSKTRRVEVPLAALVKRLERDLPQRVSGTAVFLTSDPEFAPAALMHNLKHNKVLHEQNVILTITYTDTPRVPMSDRVTIHSVSDTFFCVQMKFGYVETPNIPKALGICRKLGWKFDIMRTSFFLSRRSLKVSSRHSVRKLQDKLFVTLARNASDATDFFQIPTERVVEVGTQVTV